uniref:Uncharacterized protein n=1 Tax=Anopheles atroparvus TaxID=41427 RepID=A0AAG5DQD4_ANOAO
MESKRVKRGIFYRRRNKIQQQFENVNSTGNNVRASASCAISARAADPADEVLATTSDSIAVSAPGTNPVVEFEGDSPTVQEELISYNYDSSSIEDSECDESEGVFFQEEPEEIFDRMSPSECIRFWALTTNQTHHSVDVLLKIMRSKFKVRDLPSSAKTLLKTPRRYKSRRSCDGWYSEIKVEYLDCDILM